MRVFGQSITQSVQAFGDFLSGMTRHVLCPGIDFDARNDSRIGDDFHKGSAILLLLADRLVEEDRATDARAEAGRGRDHLTISAPGFHGQGNPQLGETFVAGRIAFIHRQQSLVVGDKCPRGVHQLLCVHL